MACVVLGSVLYAAHLGERVRYPDEREYLAIAANVLEGRGYSIDGATPTAYRAPGFVGLVLLGKVMGEDLVDVRMLNFVCLLVSLAAVFALARSVVPGGGIFAMLAVVGYPVQFYTAGTFYPQTLSGALLTTLLAVVSRGDRLTVRRAVCGGVLGGALMLTSPSMLFAFGVLALWLLAGGGWVGGVAVERGERRGDGARGSDGVASLARRAGVVGVLVLAAVLVLSPWQSRNHRRLGATGFIATNGGLNLLLGNASGARANSGVNVDLSAYAAPELDEVARDRHYRRAALDEMRARPARTVWLYARKFANHFNFRNELFVATERSPWRDLMALVTYGGLCGVVLLRLALRKRLPLSRMEWFVLLLYVANGAFAALFFTRIRFRVPFDLLLAIVAGTTMARLMRHASGRDRKPSALCRFKPFIDHCE